MDPEWEASKRERELDNDPLVWPDGIPFRGESVPGGMQPACSRRAQAEAWRLRQQLYAEGRSDAAGMDSECMTYQQWRQHWHCAENGDLVTI